MTAKRHQKSWREKLAESKDLPKTMVIPSPAEVDEVMRRLPRSRLATINEIRACLAKKHGTDIACPMTTGIFAWTARTRLRKAELRAKRTSRPTGARLRPAVS